MPSVPHLTEPHTHAPVSVSRGRPRPSALAAPCTCMSASCMPSLPRPTCALSTALRRHAARRCEACVVRQRSWSRPWPLFACSHTGRCTLGALAAGGGGARSDGVSRAQPGARCPCRTPDTTHTASTSPTLVLGRPTRPATSRPAGRHLTWVGLRGATHRSVRRRTPGRCLGPVFSSTRSKGGRQAENSVCVCRDCGTATVRSRAIPTPGPSLYSQYIMPGQVGCRRGCTGLARVKCPQCVPNGLDSGASIL